MKWLVLLFCVWLVLGGALGCVSRLVPQAREEMVARLVDEGIEALRREDLDGAEARFHAVLEMGASPEALDGVGCVAARKGDNARARAIFSQVMQRYPAYGRVAGNIASLLEREGRYAEAEHWYRRALSDAPQDPQILNDFGMFLALRGDHQGALRRLRAAAQLQPSPVIIRNLEILGQRSTPSPSPLSSPELAIPREGANR